MFITKSLFFYFLIFIFGSCIGSFLNVCIHRLPQKKSVISPASACPKCGHQLSWWENIPILSYIFLKGRCRSCSEKISIQYPIVEFITGIIALFLFFRFKLTLSFFIFFLFSAGLVVVTFIDLKHQIIPDIISIPGIIIGFLFSFFATHINWKDSILGILIGGGILYFVAFGYHILTRKEGMGGGDIKLLAMIGAFLGWKSIPLVIFLSATIGAISGIIFILIQKGDRKMAIPYGPFLSLAALITLFYGDELINWYIKLIST